MPDLSEDFMSAIKNDQKLSLSSMLANPENGVWEMIFESLPDMVALVDVDNFVVKANKAMLGMLLAGGHDIAADNKCYHVMHEKGCVVETCPHLSTIEDRKPHSVEIFEPKLGCHLNFTTIPILDAETAFVGSLHVVRNISVQQEVQAKLEENNDELKELNRSKDKFLSIVAHDLRNPFMGILGFTDFIIDELDTLDKKEIKEYLLKVRDSTQATYTLIENLLHWSRLQSGKLLFSPATLNIKDEISTIIKLLEANALIKKLKITNSVPAEFKVSADQQMLRSILLNLIANAIKFTLPGGTVTVDAKVKPMCDDTLRGVSNCKHKSLEISVSDTGVGMVPEDVSKLLENQNHFTHSGTSREQGTGLGLVLVKEMTKKHGGMLTVSSQAGIGSVFSFTLPLSIG